MPELVQEDDRAVALGGVACNLPQRLAHEPRLRAHCTGTQQPINHNDTPIDTEILRHSSMVAVL
jgi:hypothetical protein